MDDWEIQILGAARSIKTTSVAPALLLIILASFNIYDRRLDFVC
jgi:hypothetical protein